MTLVSILRSLFVSSVSEPRALPDYWDGSVILFLEVACNVIPTVFEGQLLHLLLRKLFILCVILLHNLCLLLLLKMIHRVLSFLTWWCYLELVSSPTFFVLYVIIIIIIIIFVFLFVIFDIKSLKNDFVEHTLSVWVGLENHGYVFALESVILSWDGVVDVE